MQTEKLQTNPFISKHGQSKKKNIRSEQQLDHLKVREEGEDYRG